MSEQDNTQENIPQNSLDGFEGQDDASDDVSGQEYEDMLDEGFTTPERERRADRYGNENESMEDRFYEEEPDDGDDSGYGPPPDKAIPGHKRDVDRVGRLSAPGQQGDTGDRLAADDGSPGESDMDAQDDGFAGGGSSAEEAAMHYADESGESDGSDESDGVDSDRTEDDEFED